jgi:hypothetical protein
VHEECGAGKAWGAEGDSVELRAHSGQAPPLER